MRHIRLRPPSSRTVVVISVIAVLLLAAGCTTAPPAGTGGGTTAATTELVLASTTSTQDSGLFSVLIPAFEKAYPQYKVKVVAVGSGEAMKLGETKDADVLLVHSPAAERSFMASGFGESRKSVMYNTFIIVGPAGDPAGIKETTSAVEAFKKIAAAGDAGKAIFAARGDDSGTAKKEESIWASATIDPKGKAWYLSTGQGMGEVLKLSSEKGAYTLSDEATYLSMKDTLKLDVLVQGDPKLFNPYSVIVVVGAKNIEGSRAFSDWITGADGQTVIGGYGVEKFGKPLFTPSSTSTAGSK